jgi:hypothetical protein
VWLKIGDTNLKINIHALNNIFATFGVTMRTFIANYRTDNGEYRNCDFYFPSMYADEAVIKAMVRTLIDQRRTPCAIHELTGGHSYVELEAMNPRKTAKHARLGFLDPAEVTP